MNFYVNQDDQQTTCQIEWMSDYDIKELEPFINSIRVHDGVDSIYLMAEDDDFEVTDFLDFEVTECDESHILSLCYQASISIDLCDHPKFRIALKRSENFVDIDIGFRKDGTVIDDCCEEYESQQIWIDEY